MTLFLAVFFLIYGLMHAYFIAKVRAAFPGIQPYTILVVPLLVLAPLIIRVLERNGFDLIAWVLSWIGYSWMAVLLLFLTISLAFDAWRAVAAGIHLLTGHTFASISPQKAFVVPLLAAVCLFAYGLHEAVDIRTERILLKSPKIPRDSTPIKIVQISDVHLGLIIREERLDRILERIRRENPDLVISTGDLLDGQTDNLKNAALLLREIRPKLGKIAVLGNHEYYSGFDHACDFHRRAGFVLLRGEDKQLSGFLHVIGLDDPAAKSFGLYRRLPPERATGDSSADRFVLLLRHRPVVDEECRVFDLQLSGHTHGGQIFPFSIVTRIFFHNMDRGLHLLSRDVWLYVNRGSGTWGPPIRFLTPPEVTVIEISHG